MCEDPAVRALEELGYSLIRLPRDGIDVLDVGVPRGKGAEIVGTLGGFVDSPAPYPTVETGLEAADISGTRTEAFSLAFGLELLGDVLGAFGISVPSLKGAFKSTKGVKFIFEDVRRDRMNEDTARAYVNHTDSAGHPGPIADRMDRAKDGFMLVEVLRSRKFSIEAESSRAGEAQIDFKLLEGLIGGQVGVTITRGSSTKVTFEGTRRLAFAFKPWSLYFRSKREDGVLKLKPILRPADHGVGPLAVAGAPSDQGRQLSRGLIALHVDRVDEPKFLGTTVASALIAGLAATRPPPAFTEADFESDDPEIVARIKAASETDGAGDDGGYEAMGDRLRVVAEGDSWFKFPLVSDVVDQLRLRHRMRIWNCADPGDTLLDMAYGLRYASSGLGVGPQLREVLARIDRVKPDAVLLSGGGNDFAPQLADFINDGSTGGDLLKREYLDYFLRTRVQSVYNFMIGKIREHTEAPILLHSYAYPHPTGKGAGILGFRFAGPWLLPALQERNVDPERGKRLVLDPLIDAFHATLERVVSENRAVSVCDLRSIVPNTSAIWRDELHLRSRGTKLVADAISRCVRGSDANPGDGIRTSSDAINPGGSRYL